MYDERTKMGWSTSICASHWTEDRFYGDDDVIGRDRIFSVESPGSASEYGVRKVDDVAVPVFL